MKVLLLCLAFIVSSFQARGNTLQAAIEQIRAVSLEGRGNESATTAWQVIAAADADRLPLVLAGMNGANPLAENWLRAAISAIADRSLKTKSIPLPALEAFLLDTKNSSSARVVAFDLIQQAAPADAEKLTPKLLEDPSSELRRHPVAKLLERGDELLASNDKSAALTTYQKAMASARDEDQIKPLSKKLKDLGQPVNLPTHFGFLMDWQLIAPFTNVECQGFDTKFPPEKAVDLTAVYPGKNGEAKWVPFTSKDEYGMIDFNKPFSMLKEVTGYAYTEFNAAEDGEAQLRLGCKNGWKIWLNGEFVFGRDEYHRGMKLDQYKLPVHLKKGKNTILVKCCQNEQKENWTVEWQFQLRVCDATGTAMAALSK
jgi:hypothetical protein